MTAWRKRLQAPALRMYVATPQVPDPVGPRPISDQQPCFGALATCELQVRGASGETRTITAVRAASVATRSATPMQRTGAVAAGSTGELDWLTWTPVVAAVSSEVGVHLAKVRVAGSNPLVRSKSLLPVRRAGRWGELQACESQSFLQLRAHSEQMLSRRSPSPSPPPAGAAHTRRRRRRAGVGCGCWAWRRWSWR